MESYLIWLFVGLGLMIMETLLPVAYFLWLGVSCLFMCFFAAMFSFSFINQTILFAILTPIMTILGRRLCPIHIADKHDIHINNKMSRLIGMEVKLDAPIVNGSVQQKVGETVWILKGKDTPQGAVVKIIDIDNNFLIVESSLKGD